MSVLPLALALCFAGFAAIAAAMPRHWKQLNVARSHPPNALRLIGAAALLAALATSTTIWNPARAIPIAIGLASLGGIGVGLTLAFAPRALLPLAVALPIAAGVAAAWP